MEQHCCVLYGTRETRFVLVFLEELRILSYQQWYIYFRVGVCVSVGGGGGWGVRAGCDLVWCVVPDHCIFGFYS